MIDTIIISKVIRIGIGQIAKIDDIIDKIEVGPGMSKIIGGVILEIMQGILIDKMAEESIKVITEMKTITETEMGTGLEKGHFLEALEAIEVEVQAVVGPGQDQEQV